MKCLPFCHNCWCQISPVLGVKMRWLSPIKINTPYLLFIILPHLPFIIHCADVLKTPASSNGQNAPSRRITAASERKLLQSCSLFIYRTESLNAERKLKLCQNIWRVDITSDPDSWWVLKPIFYFALCVSNWSHGIKYCWRAEGVRITTWRCRW